ncbi:MAG TPA: hypothetical protein VF078_03175 [Nitrospira sp.]
MVDDTDLSVNERAFIATPSGVVKGHPAGAEVAAYLKTAANAFLTGSPPWFHRFNTFSVRAFDCSHMWPAHGQSELTDP